jgi:hypothetical protein
LYLIAPRIAIVWLRSAFGVRVLRLISGSLRLGFFSLSVCRYGIIPGLPRQEVSLVSAVGWVSGLWRWLRWDAGIVVFVVLGMKAKFGVGSVGRLSGYFDKVWA